MSLIFSLRKSMFANGSRSPLRKRVGHMMRGQCSVRSWSGKPGRCSGYEKSTSPPNSASTARLDEDGDRLLRGSARKVDRDRVDSTSLEANDVRLHRRGVT